MPLAHRLHKPGILAAALGHPVVSPTENRVPPSPHVVHAARNDRLVLVRHGRCDLDAVWNLDHANAFGHLGAKAGVSLAAGGFVQGSDAGHSNQATSHLVDGVLEVSRELAINRRERLRDISEIVKVSGGYGEFDL